MADNTTRRVDIILSAKDGASATLDRAAMNVRRLKAETSEAFNGPAVRPRFDQFEQEARDIAAGRIRAMRNAAQRANVRERADEILFGTGGGNKIAKEAAIAGAEAGEGFTGGFLERLKAKFGRGSAFQESAELLKGGGAILGFTIAGELLSRASEGAKNFATDLREGQKSAAELTQGLMEGLPVIGGFAKAGANIREIITGEKYEIDLMLRSAEAVNHVIDANRKGAELTSQFFQQMVASAERMERMTVIAPLRGEERERATAYMGEADAEQKTVEDNNARVKAREAITTAAVEDLKSKMREAGNEAHAKELQAQIDAAQAQLKKDVEEIRSALPRELQASYKLFQTNQQQSDYQRKVDQDQKSQQRESTLSGIGTTADDRIAEINRATRREFLLSQGKTAEAEILDIRADIDRQKSELDDQIAAAQAAENEVERRKTAEYNRPGHTVESFQTELDAYRDAKEQTRTVTENANRVKAALDEQGRVREQAARERANQEQQDSERSNQQVISGIRDKAAVDNLRAMGRNADAEELELEQSHRRRLAEIQASMEREVSLHAEQGDALRRQAADATAAENESFRGQQSALQARQQDKFAPDLPSALGESRLLTGDLGEGATNPLIQPTERTAKASESLVELNKKINDGIAKLITLIPQVVSQPQVLTAN